MGPARGFGGWIYWTAGVGGKLLQRRIRSTCIPHVAQSMPAGWRDWDAVPRSSRNGGLGLLIDPHCWGKTDRLPRAVERAWDTSLYVSLTMYGAPASELHELTHRE